MARMSVSINELSTINRAIESNLNVGIVLESPRGKVNTPVVISNEQDLILNFGESTIQYPVLSSVRLYLRRYSGVIISRIKYSDAVAAVASISMSVKENATATAADKVVLKAVGESYSNFENDHVVSVEYDGTLPSKVGDITYPIPIKVIVKDKEGAVKSTISGLSLDDNTGTSLAMMVLDYNSKSEYYQLRCEAKATDLIQYSLTTAVLATAKFAGGIKGGTFAEKDVTDAISSFNSVTIDKLNVLCAPGLNTDTSIVTTGTTVAKGRGETMYLIDLPLGTTYEEMITKVSTYPRTEYGTVYYPGQIMSVPTGANKLSKLAIPGSISGLFTWAASSTNYEWSAPAGYDAKFSLPAIANDIDISNLQADTMYESTSERCAVNPIVYDTALGYLVDGQRTCALPQSIQYSANISRVCKYVYNVARSVSRPFKYKPINDATFDQWLMAIDTKLEVMKSSGGLYDYKTAMGETTMTDEEMNAGILKGIVRIKPTPVADYINISINVTSDDI